MGKFFGALVVLAFIAFFVFYMYTLVHVHQTCDGHVVKNMWDWPVCVH